MNEARKIWWLNPVWIYFGWLLFVFYCYTIDSNAFHKMFKQPIYIDFYDILLYIIFFLAFCIGFYSYKTENLNRTTINDYPIEKIIKIYNILYAMTIFAYLIWFVNIYLVYGTNAIHRLMINLTVYAEKFKDGSTNISGITSCTQLGIVAAPICTYLYYNTKNKIFIVQFIVLLTFASLRAAIFAERLAIIELLLPSLVIYAYYGNIFNKKIIKFAPLIGVFLLLLVFGFFEYYRSWNFYKESYHGNIIPFVIDRVFGYYSIAINTECIQINYVGPKYFFESTLTWLWKLSGGDVLKEFFLEGSPQFKLMPILKEWGNPEFNNPGGLLFAYNDIGFFGLIIQLLFGRLVAIAYTGYCKGDFILSLWYSATFLCMLELPRYFFWGSTRAFLVIIGILVLTRYLKRVTS